MVSTFTEELKWYAVVRWWLWKHDILVFWRSISEISKFLLFGSWERIALACRIERWSGTEAALSAAQICSYYAPRN